MADIKDQKSESWENLYWEPHQYNDRAQLKTGTYLRTYCPFCETELTRDDVLTLEVIDPQGNRGSLELNPRLNVYHSRTRLKIPEGMEVKDLICPECHKSLIVKGMKCENGDARVAGLLVGVSNLRVPFYICTRAGCHWHAIDPADKTRIILEDSNEW